MKVVIVLGFYDKVFVRLQKDHAALLQNRTIVWVGLVGPHGDGDIINFRELLLDRLHEGFTDVLVLAVVRRGRDDFAKSISETIRWALGQYPAATINLRPFDFAAAALEVYSEITKFLKLSAQEEVFPADLQGIEGWCCNEAALRDRVLVMPRAINEARASSFGDAALVYKSLKILASQNWDLRVYGGPDRKRAWHVALESLGLTVAPSISKSRAGEQGDEYYVSYPAGSPLKRFLEQHLKKGNDRDPHLCFRLYFFWDKKKRLVVVGWLPSHLDTRAT